MSTARTIGILVLVYLIIMAIVKILGFYGVSTDAYAVYLTFYVFLVISYFFLPTGAPDI
jgi:uncharacterized membrane protein YtjA (UPF0391 family)